MRPPKFSDLTDKTPDGRHQSFVIRDLDVSTVNSFRRILLSEMPNAAFVHNVNVDDATDPSSNVWISVNTSCVNNDILAHRLSMMPLMLTERQISDGDEFLFELSAKNSTDAVVTVTTDAFRVSHNGRPVPNVFFPERGASRCTVVTLRPNLVPNGAKEEVVIACRSKITTAKASAGYSPLSQASYAFELDPLEVERRRAVAKDPATFECTEKQRCYVKDEHDEPCAFVFVIESECRQRPTWMFARAIEILRAKVTRLRGSFGEISASAKRVAPNLSEYPIHNEDHTLVDFLSSFVVNSEVREKGGAKITACGYTQPHVDDNVMILSVRFVSDVPSEHDAALRDSIDGCVVHLDEVVRAFLAFAPQARRPEGDR